MRRRFANISNSKQLVVRLTILMIISIAWVSGFSQTEFDSTGTYTFKVNNPKTEIMVEQKDSVMYTDWDNPLRIRVDGKNKLGPVVVDGGSILRNGNNFIVKVKEGNRCVLAVYIQKPNGKIELGLSRTYQIVYLEDPVPLIGGVKPDSIIRKHELLEANGMYAKLTRFKKTTPVKIISFEMQVFMDTLEVNYTSMGERFSPEMRRYMQQLKPGVPLNFTQIICQMPNGAPRRLRDMKLFVDCSPRCVSAKE